MYFAVMAICYPCLKYHVDIVQLLSKSYLYPHSALAFVQSSFFVVAAVSALRSVLGDFFDNLGSASKVCSVLLRLDLP